MDNINIDTNIVNNQENDEVWKRLYGFEGLYEISSLGRIKSLSRLVGNKNNRKGKLLSEDILSGYSNKKGKCFCLRINGKGRTILLHRAMAETFLFQNKMPDNKFICHIDKNIYNNNLKNIKVVNYPELRFNKEEEKIKAKKLLYKLRNDKIKEMLLNYESTAIKNPEFEQWKPLNGFEDKYIISSLGKIKNIINGEVKNPRINQDGYFIYSLINGGKKLGIALHKLIAIHFIPNPNNHKHIHHIDQNKINNSISNLIWINESDHHIIENAVLCNKRQINRRALTVDEAKEIKRLYNTKMYLRADLAKMFKTGQPTIDNIIMERLYRDIK